jgi:hypothetical protein
MREYERSKYNHLSIDELEANLKRLKAEEKKEMLSEVSKRDWDKILKLREENRDIEMTLVLKKNEEYQEKRDKAQQKKLR